MNSNRATAPEDGANLTEILRLWAHHQPDPQTGAGTFSIRRLNADNRDRAVSCVASLYPRGNLIAGALGFTDTDYRPIAERVVDATLAADMGLLVLDPRDEVVGFHFSLDLVDELAGAEAMTRDADPRVRAWGELLHRLLCSYVEAFGAPRARGEAIYFNITALGDSVRGLGMMPALQVQAALTFALQRGYGAIVGIATHPRTRALVRGLTPCWTAEQPFAELTEPRLRTIEGAAQIVRYDLSRFRESLAAAQARNEAAI